MLTDCLKTLKSSHFMLITENAVLPPKKSINLLLDIFKYHLEAGFSKWHQNIALTHVLDIHKSTCINHLTWNFLHAQS